MKNLTLINKISILLSFLLEAQRVYLECANAAKNDNLKRLLCILSDKRQIMINDLQNEVTSLRGLPIHMRILNPIHQLFFRLKFLIGKGNKNEIREMIKQNENLTMTNYKTVLKGPVPISMRSVLSHQLHEIAEDISRIDELLI